MKRWLWVSSIALVVLVGCARWFRSEDENREHDEIQAIHRARKAALAKSSTSEDWFEFAKSINGVLVRKGKLPASFFDDAWQLLDRAAKDPKLSSDLAQAEIEYYRGMIRHQQERKEDALRHYVRCVNIAVRVPATRDPSANRFPMYCFSGATHQFLVDNLDEVVLQLCPLVFPYAKVEGWSDTKRHIATCLEAAKGDRSKLAWAEAELREIDRIEEKYKSKSFVVESPSTDRSSPRPPPDHHDRHRDKPKRLPGRGKGARCERTSQCQPGLYCAIGCCGSHSSGACREQGR